MVEAAIHGVKIMGKVLHDNNKLSTGQEKPPFISIWQSITKLFKYFMFIILSFDVSCLDIPCTLYFRL